MKKREKNKLLSAKNLLHVVIVYDAILLLVNFIQAGWLSTICLKNHYLTNVNTGEMLSTINLSFNTAILLILSIFMFVFSLMSLIYKNDKGIRQEYFMISMILNLFLTLAFLFIYTFSAIASETYLEWVLVTIIIFVWNALYYFTYRYSFNTQK